MLEYFIILYIYIYKEKGNIYEGKKCFGLPFGMSKKLPIREPLCFS